VLTDSVRDSWDPVYSHLGLSRRVGANVDKDVWINSTGSIGHLEGNDNADGLRTTTGGFLAGDTLAANTAGTLTSLRN